MNAKFNLTKLWYAPPQLLTYFLLPFAWIFRLLIALRYGLYRLGLKQSHQVQVPVIVVGNITVGGTGKTPFVIWLTAWLTSQGYRPGIITRGVGGKIKKEPHLVKSTDLPEVVGDEALLLQRNSQCPVVVCSDKVKAARTLVEKSHCNMIVSDDGLQHYRLDRQIEINIIDGLRHFGNCFLLPAGPLREPITRLKKVDFIIVNDNQIPRINSQDGVPNDYWEMQLEPLTFVSVKDPSVCIPLDAFNNQLVHAIAGIGNPERFFIRLKALNIQLKQKIFPDHHLFSPCDLAFNDTLPIIMTEKDAVKCRNFAQPHWWYLSAGVKLTHGFTDAFCKVLQKKGVV